MVGKQVQLVVRTRDQEKQIVFVEGMNVSTGLGKGSGKKLGTCSVYSDNIKY